MVLTPVWAEPIEPTTSLIWLVVWALPIPYKTNPKGLQQPLLNLAELSLHAAYFIKKCGIVPPLQGATHISKEYALGLVFYALHRRLVAPWFTQSYMHPPCNPLGLVFYALHRRLGGP